MKPEQRSMDGGLTEGRVADHPGASGLDPGRGQRWAQGRVPGPLRRLCHLCEHVLKVEVSQHVPILQETHIMGGAGLPAPPPSAPPPSARPIHELPGPYPPPRPKPQPPASASFPPDGPAPNRERRPRPRPPALPAGPAPADNRPLPPGLTDLEELVLPREAYPARREAEGRGSGRGVPLHRQRLGRPGSPRQAGVQRGRQLHRPARWRHHSLPATVREPAGAGPEVTSRHFRCRRGFRCEQRRTGAPTRGESGRGRWGLSLAGGGRRRGSVSLPRAPPPAVRRPLRGARPAGVSPPDPALGYGAGLCAASPTVHVPNSNRAASLLWRLPPLLRPHYPHPCSRRVCLPPEGLARPLGRAGLQTSNQTGARVVFAKFTSYGNASLFKALRWLPVTLVQRLSRSLSGPARSACLSSLLPPISS